MYNYLKQLKEKQMKGIYKTSQQQEWKKNKSFIFAKVSVIESQGTERKKEKEHQEESLQATVNTIISSSPVEP